MRMASSLIVLAAVVFGAFTLAGADAPDAAKMQKRIEALEMQVKYLHEREDALTNYIVMNEQRAAGIQDVTQRSRAAGFEMNRIPKDSRIILLKGFDDLAASLRMDLPVLTKEQQALRKKIDAFRRTNQIGK